MTTTAERKESPPYAMHGGRIIGRILKENGVKHVFGVEGGHIYPFETGFYEFGIKRLHMRHEQAGAYAADAYARCTRSPGICYGTAGPGMTNMVSGINQAWLVRSPMVCLFGQHRRDLDHKRPFQEGYGVPVCDTMSKWGVFIEEWRLLPLYLRKALRECMIYPPGPVVLAMEPRALYIPADEKTLVGDVPNSAKAAPSVGGAKAEDVERAVRMLIQAERPALVGGDGIYWADAGPELLELAELLNIPVNTRRMGRGAVPEDHPLAIHAGWRLSFWPKADTILLAGLKINSDLENNGEPPTWPAQAKRIYLHESIMDAWAPVPMEMEIIANPKVALRQMIDCAQSLVKRPPQRKAWLEHLARVRKDYDAGMKASSEEVRGNVPIHGFHVAQEIVDFLDPSATVIFDAYSGTAHLTARLKAKFAGQVLDSGECGGVGHGIGMGIGAQVARPGKQVLVMMGDAGVGVGGMDIETAARYNLPIVYLVYNNSTWMGGTEQLYFKGQMESWGMMKDIRYDKMFEPLGCHVENVTQPQQVRPALERSFSSGKTAVINVVVDNRVPHPQHLSSFYRGFIARCLDDSKLQPETRDLFHKGPTPEVEEEMMRKGWPRLASRGKVGRGDAGRAPIA